MFSYKVYKSFSDELELLWNDLIKKSQHTVYQTFHINKIWYNSIGTRYNSSDLLIFVFFNSNRIVAIAPMILHTKFKIIKQLNFLGDGIFDYQMIICQNKNKLNLNEYVFNSIKSHVKVDMILMSNIPGFFKKNNINYNLYMRLNSVHKILMLDLPDSYETFFNRLKSSIRGDSRRQRNKIKNYGEPEYKIVKNGNKYFLNKLINFKRIRYKDTNVYDIFNIPGYADFFKNLYYSKSFKFIHSSTLNIGDESISFHLGFIYLDKYYYFFPSFNQEKWGRYSPSRLHMLDIINEAISKKIKTFDFTVGNERYKKYFADNSSVIYNYEQAISILGHLYLFSLKYFYKLKNTLFKNKILKFFVLKIR